MKRIFLSPGMLIIIVAFLIVLFFVVFSEKLTSSNQTAIIPTPTPKILDVGPFSVTVPGNWHYTPQTGEDSQVGMFQGDNITLLFDYGKFPNELARDGDPKYTITYELIDGKNAKIVKSNIPGKGLNGIYFEKLLGINGENIPQTSEETVFRIFRSVKFHN